MLVNITGAKCIGIDAVKVTVEVDIRNGIGIHLVGLADTAVKESLLRTVNALQALGFHIPGKKIVINLAPADLHKKGSGYDLPIAVGIIAASEQLRLERLEKYIIMGELGLDGSIREIEGALSMVQMARDEGFDGCILPLQSALEAVDFRDTEVYGVRNLTDVLRILEGGGGNEEFLIWNTPEYRALLEERQTERNAPQYMDFSEIIGQESAKRGLEIAASGAHNAIMIGSPGCGKSSLAKALAGILPPLTKEEALLTSKIWSVAGKGNLRRGLVSERPVRAPHYSASLAAMVGGGGGDNILPGEVSLAHGGVLFLDEFGQLPKSVSEALRGPLEDRKVSISRLRVKVEYPASFMLIAASNPCPCGYWGEGDRCQCTPTQRLNYLSRLSGPIMDRIDLQMWLRPVDAASIARGQKGETSAEVSGRVARARELQVRRFKDEGISANAEMSNRQIEIYCPLSSKCQDTMQKVTDRMNLSMRSYFRTIKVARTIADLAGREEIRPEDLMEAASFRFLDKRNLP